MSCWHYLTTPVHAGEVVIPNVFTAGSPAIADQVNQNFEAQTDAINDNHVRITKNTTDIGDLQGGIDTLNNAVPPLPSLIIGPEDPTAIGSYIAASPDFTQVDSLQLPPGNWLINFNLQIDVLDQAMGTPPYSASAAAKVLCKTNYRLNDSLLESRLTGIAWGGAGLSFNTNVSSNTLSTLVQTEIDTEIVLECTNLDSNGSLARINRSHVTALQVGTVLRAHVTEEGSRELPQ